MAHFNFYEAGVQQLPISGPFVQEFYCLDLSKTLDPFTIARKLWDTGKFQDLVFDTYGEPL